MAICEPKQKSSAAAGLLEWMAVAAKVRLARGGGGGGGVGEIVQVGSGSSWRVERLLIHALLDVTGGDGARQVEELTVGEAVLRLVEDGIGVDVRRPNPFTTGLPMVASPAPVVACIALYLLVVWLWSSHIKASGQKPRREDPLALRCLVIVHNLFLCCLSLFMAVGLVAAARQYGYSLWGNAYSEGQPAMHFLIYMFYMSKLYEFVDTAIMLLRRNLRQVTYLHIYHHASIAFMWWLICYRFPGADAYFSAAFNSSIHVVMYLYYLLSAIIGKDEQRRRKYLFWGKYLTMMQMVQFMSFIGNSIYAMWRPENYPKGFPRMLFFYSVSLLAFFGNFFVKKYWRPVMKAAEKSE